MRDLRASYPAMAAAAAASQRPSSCSGWIEAEIYIEEAIQGVRQILHLGAEVEVIGPPSLRAAVRAEARQVAALYAGERRTSAARRAR